MRTKILVIGLDGATFKIIKPLTDQNKIPFISQLMKEGAYGNLETYYPTLSPLEWASFYTGMNPGKLGIFALSQIGNFNKVSNFKSINASYIKYPSIWKILSKVDKKVGVMNIPATYPLEDVNGFMISGFLTPDDEKKYFYPLSLKKYLFDYKIDVEFIMHGLPDKNVNKNRILEEQYLVTENRFKTTMTLLNEYDLDFFCINFKSIDNIQHLFWNDYDVISDYYNKIDTYIEDINELYQPTHIILMSDHGFHEAEDKYFYINSWLKKEKYLYIKKNLLNMMYSQLVNLGEKIVSKYKWLRFIIPESIKQKMIRDYVGNQINFQNSKVFGSMWGLFIIKNNINLENYNIIMNELIEKLTNLRDSHNISVFKTIYKKTDIYKGDDLDDFPDLIPIPNTKYLVNPIITNKIISDRIDKPYIKGAHKSDNIGILIIKGDGIKKDFKIDNANISDLTPTILQMFKYKTPNYMDGAPLNKIFLNDYKDLETLKNVHNLIKEKDIYEFSDEEEDLLIQRLKKLGYIE